MALPASSWANITNIASVAYNDLANNTYTGISNSVSITTPPTITSALTATADVGVAFSYQMAATNSPTGFSASGLSGTGLTVNSTTGLISGTPTVGGPLSVSLSASNAAGAGPSATLVITVRGAASITLNKVADVSTAKSGNTVTFTINYQNNGAGSAANVVITDAIPAGSSLVNGTISNGGSITAGTITWNVGTVAAGVSGSVSFKVTVN